jgi:hypothetical protein
VLSRPAACDGCERDKPAVSAVATICEFLNFRLQGSQSGAYEGRSSSMGLRVNYVLLLSGSVVVKELHYKPKGRGFETR